MSKIMKIIDERERENNKYREKQRGGTSYTENVRTKWFCCAFKLGFIQLICKASLIFKLILELTLSIILKERELYESKQHAVECRCLKIWDLLSFLVGSSILVLNDMFQQWTTARSAASTSKFIY